MRRRLSALCLLVMAIGLAIPVATAVERRVCITIDDLPKAGGSQDVKSVDAVTGGILDALAKHQAPAVGFVTSRNVFAEGDVDARLAALRRWLDAGLLLGNHSYSHRSFHKLSLAEYKDDVIQGDLVPRLLMEERGKTIRYYRHPFNHTGATPEDRAGFEAFMAGRGYQVVPFTVEHADYMFNDLFVAAMEAGDDEAADRIGAAYLEQIDRAFGFAENLSRETFQREIPQVFLIHSNDINARYLDAMLGRIAARGYAFISFDEALADPAYQTRDDYIGPTGISWLHRWRHSLSLPDKLREEPDPPRWMIDEYRALAARK